MTRRVSKPKAPRHTMGDINVLKAHLAEGESRTFDEIRLEIPRFAGWTDGELHEAAEAAGLVVE